MCVIHFAFNKHPDFPLILTANRDEYYDRPAERAKTWEDFPAIYAGRDLIAGGTWLGINVDGKFAAVTNYRDPKAASGISSRGNLTVDFLKNDESAKTYLNRLRKHKDDFSGFNLLIGEISSEKNEVFYFSNRQNTYRELGTGIYGLSNHFLDTPWQKVEKGKRYLEDILTRRFTNEDLFQMLADETPAGDSDLPDTGIGKQRERLLSSVFIKSENYGTRCSTVLSVDKDFKFDFEERVFV